MSPRKIKSVLLDLQIKFCEPMWRTNPYEFSLQETCFCLTKNVKTLPDSNLFHCSTLPMKRFRPVVTFDYNCCKSTFDLPKTNLTFDESKSRFQSFFLAFIYNNPNMDNFLIFKQLNHSTKSYVVPEASVLLR